MPLITIPKKGLIIPKNLNKGFKVPIMASFTGIKNIPILALGYNNGSPKLMLYTDHLECKVILNKTVKYKDIENVDFTDFWLTKAVILNFKNKRLDFAANLYKKENLVELIKFFDKKKIPLSKKARMLLH